MGSQFFHCATNTRIGDNNIFQHVGGNVNNYFNYPSSRKQEEDRIMPRQNEFREFLKGDICLQEQTWSEETELVIRVPSRDKRLHRRDVGRRVKVTKKFHTATIFQHSDQKFTVVTFEPKHNRPRNKETMRLGTTSVTLITLQLKDSVPIKLYQLRFQLQGITGILISEPELGNTTPPPHNQSEGPFPA
ncbi:hypothetical protein PQX77_022326 [Marasmius sp. AFHP31]|nr:hypothetical protein PQX77_022326 [Marasmius sp. AFHP31]